MGKKNLKEIILFLFNTSSFFVQQSKSILWFMPIMEMVKSLTH